MDRADKATGGGFSDWLSSAASKFIGRATALVKGVRIDYPPSVRDTLQKMGMELIVDIKVCRSPVEKYVQAFLNVASFGQYNKSKSQLPYDDVYHVYMVFSTKSGRYLLEKKEVVDLIPYTQSEQQKREGAAGYGAMVVPLLKQDTLVNILNKTREMMTDKLFFTYDPFTNNCQYFLNAVLHAAQVLGDINYMSTVRDFVFQNVQQLTDSLSSTLKKAATATTGLAHRINILIHGKGFSAYHANNIAAMIKAGGPNERAFHIANMDPESIAATHLLCGLKKDSDRDCRFVHDAQTVGGVRNSLHVLNKTVGGSFFNSLVSEADVFAGKMANHSDIQPDPAYSMTESQIENLTEEQVKWFADASKPPVDTTAASYESPP